MALHEREGASASLLVDREGRKPVSSSAQF